MVVIPGTEGQFGILADHAPLIAAIDAGVIRVYDGETVVDQVFVDGGFAEVTGERCTVLAERATPVSDLDAAELEEQIANLSEDLSMAESDADKRHAAETLRVAKAKLNAVRPEAA